MQHDKYPYEVMQGFKHDICDETGYCKVCGLHVQMIVDEGYMCRFSLNLVAISHLRAKVRIEERERRRQKLQLKSNTEKFKDYINEIGKYLEAKPAKPSSGAPPESS